MTQHHFVGNLTTDPEFHTSETGTLSARLRIAVNDRYFDPRSGRWRDREPTFWDCYAWNKRAAAIQEQRWRRGQAVIIIGEFTTSRWTGADGVTQSRVHVSIVAAGKNALLDRDKAGGRVGAEEPSAAAQASMVPVPVPGALPGTGPVDAEAEAGL